MSAKVLSFTGETTIPITVEHVLDSAKDANLARVLVIGRTEDGTLYAAANDSDLGEAFVMIEQFKKIIIDSLS